MLNCKHPVSLQFRDLLTEDSAEWLELAKA
jgi:hypothetical protein